MLPKIGVSLPPSVFDGNINKSTVFPALNTPYSLFEFLAKLNDIGVSSIELRAIGPHLLNNVTDQIYTFLKEHSLDLTVHSTLNYNSVDEFFSHFLKIPKRILWL